MQVEIGSKYTKPKSNSVLTVDRVLTMAFSYECDTVIDEDHPHYQGGIDATIVCTSKIIQGEEAVFYTDSGMPTLLFLRSMRSFVESMQPT